jgi:hypothetical protein
MALNALIPNVPRPIGTTRLPTRLEPRAREDRPRVPKIFPLPAFSPTSSSKHILKLPESQADPDSMETALGVVARCPVSARSSASAGAHKIDMLAMRMLRR